jgi:hypothetical protein
MDVLNLTAEYLLQHETMDGETFKYVYSHRELPPEKSEGQDKKEEEVKEAPTFIDVPLEKEDSLSGKEEAWTDPFIEPEDKDNDN